MKKNFGLLFAIIAAMGCGAVSFAAEPIGFANDPYSAQISYDSFNKYSVRQRMVSARFGNAAGGLAVAPLKSDGAYAMAPSSRTASGGRRQLDCVYYNGFTVWGDYYATWAKQSTKNYSDGYKYDVNGPAIGFDWSRNGLTLGLATTYNWGKIRGDDFPDYRKTRTWALTAYGQYDANRWYANATFGYARNTFKSSRPSAYSSSWPFFPTLGQSTANYNSNAINADGEFGMKFGFGNFKISPNIGLRYFNNHRGSFSENGYGWYFYNNNVTAMSNTYDVMELPIGVLLSYEANLGSVLLIPQVRAKWVPELFRKRGWVEGYEDGWYFSHGSPNRNRHGFELGTGLEAKFTQSFSAHIDYNVNFRKKAYEHHLNVGVGFSF